MALAQVKLYHIILTSKSLNPERLYFHVSQFDIGFIISLIYYYFFQTNEFHSEQLRDVQVWTVKHETCRWLYLLGVRITTEMLCIGWLGVGGRDQCWGDSGGPVFHNGVVVGVCAFGGGCRTPQSYRYPSVNARVSSYSTWIQANA